MFVLTLVNYYIFCTFQENYHVVFFDDPVSRAWVGSDEIKTFYQKDIDNIMVIVYLIYLSVVLFAIDWISQQQSFNRLRFLCRVCSVEQESFKRR